MLERKFININGNNMSYFESGTGNTTIIFSSGFSTPLTLADMYEIFERLSISARCICLDRFGYGFSDVIISDRSVYDITDEIILFCKKLNINTEDVIYVGHSISTFYGLYLNSKVKLKGLVLIDNEKIGKVELYLTRICYSMYYLLKNTFLKKFFNKSAVKTLFKGRNIPDEVREEGIFVLKERLPNENMKDELITFTKNLNDILYSYDKTIFAKTLLVCRDSTFKHNENLKKYFKDVKVLNVGKSEHFIQYYHYDKIAKCIKEMFSI